MARKIDNDTLRHIITESIMEIMNEANNNLSHAEFVKDCRKIGLTIMNTTMGQVVTYDGIKLNVNHGQHEKKVKADTLRDIVANLDKLGYFDNPEHVRNFPWGKWGFNPDNYGNSHNKQEQEEIERANRLYADAKIEVVYFQKDSVCVLIRSEAPRYNLCRSKSDRRPLLDRWFDEYSPTRQTQPSMMAFKAEHFDEENDEAYDEVYPIYPDGHLGDMLKESIDR